MDEKLAERGPVAAVGGQLANTQKNVRNYGGFRCGWLYLQPKMSTQNTSKNAKKRQRTENQKNIKI